MLSTHGEEILGFIRDFETSSREYLLSKGLSEYEMTNAYLDLQWNFLHTILKQHAIRNRKTSPHFFVRSKKQAI
ncbi:MAG: hypothetical protein Q8912_05425 [Bacillota bacterium]|nr:hypothetical protein [Bacillota bacterium]MDP4158435.1 hypothetical protein [Bacillota bacterium]